MKHKTSIIQLKKLISSTYGTELALVYGSYGRGDYNPNSDLDIHILTNGHYNESQFITFFQHAQQFAIHVETVLESLPWKT